jgi:hypothetical protein
MAMGGVQMLKRRKIKIAVVSILCGTALAALFSLDLANHSAIAADDAAKAQPASPQIDPKVTGILRAACDKLSAAKTLSFNAQDTYEHGARNGQPLYYTVLDRVVMQRPDKLRVLKVGDGIPDEFYYDGKSMMAYVPSADLIAVSDAPPTIDRMLDTAWNLGAIYFPFADVIASKPCAVFDKMVSAFYVGQSVVVGGTKTDMVAVASDDVQAELWIGTTDHLPRMIRVVYKNEPAHARYQTEYSDWKLDAPTNGVSFRSAKAETAKHMSFSPPGAIPYPKAQASGEQK